MPLEMKEELKIYGVPIINSVPEKLHEGLKGHPDILIHQLPSGEVVCSRESLPLYSLFMDFNFIPCENPIGDYPYDIGLNGVRIKNYFVHNTKYTDPVLLNFYRENGYEIIDVKQGYTKCSTVVGDDFIITSDRTIYSALKDRVDSLLIDHKQVKLKGFNYGFIGGASGFINGELVFTGRLNNHSSEREVLEFLQSRNIKIRYLSNRPIEDYGSIIPMEEL